MDPMPEKWKCGVIHPRGLDPSALNPKEMPRFCRALEVLVHIKTKVEELGLVVGGCLSIILLSILEGLTKG